MYIEIILIRINDIMLLMYSCESSESSILITGVIAEFETRELNLEVFNIFIIYKLYSIDDIFFIHIINRSISITRVAAQRWLCVTLT